MKKDLMVLGGFALLASVAITGLFVYGLKVTSTSLAMSVVAQGVNAPISTRVNYVIRTESQWQQFKALFSGTKAPKFPSVDFSKDQVLAVFTGTKPTDGYSIHVSKITDTTHGRLVAITLVTPGSNCTVAPTQTSPYEIVTVPATTLTLSHTNLTKVRPCR